MATVTSYGGLIVRKQAQNQPYNGGLRRYYHPATDAAALLPGDPVIIAGDGDANGVPTATLATAGANRVTGVVVSAAISSLSTPNGYTNGVAASTAGYVLVEDNPDAEFEVQEDGVGGFLAATNISQNCNLISAAGNASYGSGWLLDSSTAATTATLQVRILGLADRPNNVIGGYTRADGNVVAPYWRVRINLPTETGTAGSTGV